MTTNRENHFVPQFYLRNFSEDRRRINLFNFSRGQIITEASIKHQCSRRNFYDFAQHTEQAFADLEGGTAKSIRRLNNECDIPEEHSDDWATLLLYIVLQSLRTTSSAKTSDAILNYTNNLIADNKSASTYFDSTDTLADNVNSIEVPLSIAGDVLAVAADLKGHLLVNRAGREFITSDDPVVFHNQYCEGITYQGVTGWNCRGLQVFWPISPRHLVVLYDRRIYKIGKSHKGSTITDLFSEQDVIQLNSLQILNSLHNVYFSGSSNPNVVEAECKTLRKRRPKTRNAFVESESTESKPEESNELIHYYRPILPVKLCISEITVRRNCRRIPLQDRARMYRNMFPISDDLRGSNCELPLGRYDVKKITKL